MASYDFDNGEDFINTRDIASAIEDFESEIEDLESDIDELQEEVDELEEKRADEEDDDAIDAFNKDIEKVEEKIKEKKDEKVSLEQELEILKNLEDEFKGYCDWRGGETLIRETCFVQYCKDLIDDIGDLPSKLPSYIENNIDWEGVAEDLKADYTSGDYDGVEYLVRSS